MISPPFDKSLNCTTWNEVVQRIKFQDAVTTWHGSMPVDKRNRLWNQFKSGKLIKLTRKDAE